MEVNAVFVSRVAEFFSSGEEKKPPSGLPAWITGPWGDRDVPSYPWSFSNQKGREAARMLGGCLASSLNSPVVWQMAYLCVYSVTQSYPTLCDVMGCSLLGFSVHGISQARTLEWLAISFSKGSSWIRDRTWIACIVGRCFYWSFLQGVQERISSSFF